MWYAEWWKENQDLMGAVLPLSTLKRVVFWHDLWMWSHKKFTITNRFRFLYANSPMPIYGVSLFYKCASLPTPIYGVSLFYKCTSSPMPIHGVSMFYKCASLPMSIYGVSFLLQKRFFTHAGQWSVISLQLRFLWDSLDLLQLWRPRFQQCLRCAWRQSWSLPVSMVGQMPECKNVYTCMPISPTHVAAGYPLCKPIVNPLYTCMQVRA